MRPQQIAVLSISGLITVLIAFALYEVLATSVDWLWQSGPDRLWSGAPPWGFVMGMPVLAGIVVVLIRRSGANGPGPLGGLHLEASAPHVFPGLLAAIAVTMLGGLALGPEAALLTTGGFIGGEVARRFGIDQKTAVTVMGVCAIGGLLVGPLLSGSLNVSAGYVFALRDVVFAVAAAVATVAVLAIVRFAAGHLERLERDGRPRFWLAIAGAIAVAGTALVYQSLTGEPVALAMTSGEQMIKPLLALGSVGAIGAAVAAKAVIYAASLGTGFRGGAYFPAMFIGAGCGGLLAFQFDGSLAASATSGLLAAVTYLAQVKWGAVLALTLGVGFVVGGVALLPFAFIGAAIGRTVPRVDVGSNAATADTNG